jgi:hypothetical protein
MSRDRDASQEYWEEPSNDGYEHDVLPRRRRRREDEEADFRPRRRRRARWPFLLVGCIGGIFIVAIAAAVGIFAVSSSLRTGGLGSVGNAQTYTSTNRQPLGSASIAQVQVHNQIGDVSITVDQAVTAPTVTTIKKVEATSSASASKEFGRILVQVQPPSAPSNTLTVSTSIPNASGTILGKASDTVDVMITLPAAAITNAGTPLAVNVVTSVGNVTVSGLNAVLVVKNDIGNVTAHQTRLVDGSHLETGTGDVIFDGTLDTSGSLSSDPCNNPTSASHPMYKIQSERGNVDVTLPVTTNVILDANVNVGMINSEFAIKVTNTGGSPSYCGSLLSNPLTPPAGVLVLNVSSGNIALHAR